MKIIYEATYRQVSVPANVQQYSVVRMEISLAFIAPGDIGEIRVIPDRIL